MSATGPVGIGVVGAGNISAQYLPNMRRYPDLDVRFVADQSTERAHAAADEYGIAGFGSLDQLLRRDDVEIVVNLTTPAMHAQVSGAALSAGKHVWTEKPITTDRSTASALVEQAESAGLMIGSAPDTVLGPAVQAMLRAVVRGDIGRPLTASMALMYAGPHTWHPNPGFLYQAGAGPLMDNGPYYLTALTQILGSITRVVGMGSTSQPTRTIQQGPLAGETISIEAPTYIAALVELESGLAQGTFSFESPLMRLGVFEVTGTEATIIGPDPNEFAGAISIVRAGRSEPETVDIAAGSFGRGIGVVDMARALRCGGSARASGRLGLHVLDAMLAVHESIEGRSPVDIHSRILPAAPLPDDWDPCTAVLTD